jgi:hypothetical protein
MATSTHCGEARIQPVSRAPRAATATAAARTVDGGQATVPGEEQPSLLPYAAEQRGTAWEQAYPGSADQLAYLRAGLRPLLGDCPMADDVILIMSELGANAVRYSRSRERSGTFTARLLDAPGQYVLGEIEDGGSDWSGDLQGSARDASGLDLLLKLSAACGVSGDTSKRVVWFRLSYPAAGPRPAGGTQGET